MWSRHVGIFLLVFCTYTQPGIAAGGELCSVRDRRAEELLRHRRIDLSGVVQKQRDSAAWKKLVPPSAPLMVVNLWSLACKPCLEELPLFRTLMQEQPGVPFFFIADPGNETSRESAASFWARPLVELADTKKCLGQVPPRGTAHTCLLSLPGTEPSRSENERLVSSLGDKEGATAARPITLLIDRSGVVRDAYVGSVLDRADELRKAITRLRNLLQAAPASTPPESLSRRPLSRAYY